MSVSLEGHRELLEGADPAVRDTLAASFAEAARCMSPRALEGYLEGATALRRLGRGTDLVVSYLQAMPPVCREVGEDVLADCVGAAMKLASMVSGEVVGLSSRACPRPPAGSGTRSSCGGISRWCTSSRRRRPGACGPCSRVWTSSSRG